MNFPTALQDIAKRGCIRTLLWHFVLQNKGCSLSWCSKQSAEDYTFALSEIVGAIAGALYGIQTVAIQRWLEDDWRGWRRTSRTILVYTLVWAIIFLVVAYGGIRPDTQKPLLELRDAVLLSLPFPMLAHLIRRTSSQS